MISGDTALVDRGGAWGGARQIGCLRHRAHFFAFDLAPLLHSTSSAAAFFADSAADFWFATSAFCRKPWVSRAGQVSARL